MNWDAAGQGLAATFTPNVFGGIAVGLLIGLVFGAVPGLHGVLAIVLVLPFVWGMDPFVAFAILLSLTAAVQTSNTFPAFYFNVPGSPSAAATVIDGYPMAKNGEAAKGLVASFCASAVGGVVAAAILFLLLPLLRPLALAVATPERLMLVVLGLFSVSALSGRQIVKGLLTCLFGLLIGTVGQDPQYGHYRYTFGSAFLYDGINLVPLVMGLFALPEVISLAARGQIASDGMIRVGHGLRDGVRAVIRHKWLMLACGAIGTTIGALPGLGGTAAAFYAYAFAVSSTRRDDRDGFGHGDVRGVIAPESANNASAVGELVPLLAFGIPGGATTAVLLSAFLILGITPGGPMFGEHLPLTYAMVFIMVIANIVATVVCIAVTGRTAPITALRCDLLIPVIMFFVLFGAYAGLPDIGSLAVTLVFGVLGYLMTSGEWPRVPLLVGFILGPLVENNLFIALASYGPGFLLRPVPLVVIAVIVVVFAAGLVRRLRR
ncbi:MAG: tripartite tricarboxylate transporter permease [Hyphomicrobiales bacterium]|nr:tripartite tricarboxylate transporter permease [Hyphomicrobiales bacterium]